MIAKNRALARALLSKRDVIARRLVESICLYPRWKTVVEGEDIDAIVERDLAVFVDYLIKAFERGDEDYLALYAGEKLKQQYDSNIDLKLLAEISAKELAESREIFCNSVAGEVNAATLGLLVSTLNDIERSLTTQAATTLHVLWVADCIYLDIQAFLLRKTHEMGVFLDIALVTTKDAIARRQEIQKLTGEKKFDIVFYSPLSYEFNLDFALFQSTNVILANASDKQNAIDSAVHDINLTLKSIVENVECDVFVHNTANLVRSENTLKARTKFHATARARKLARELVNAEIVKLVEQCNQNSFGSVCQINELELVEKMGEWDASQYFHKSAMQHPARLGALLAHVYADIIFVETYLKPIKLIVADLDDTLWNGVIGEGDVVHYLDRQRTLRLLKEKGILLSINSKNDATNVHWCGGILDDSDFISKQINWDSKPQNMMRIQKELNLQFRNFLFLDDRAEEREMVRMSIPDILCLDSRSQDTWRQLAVWADIAKNAGELDRTKVYIERAARESFSTVEVDHAVLMAQLQLEVSVHEPQKEELPRVTELINRTSQFNCCNSRTTFREIQSRSKDSGWKIYVVDAKDRFGDMGIVGVLIARVGMGIIDIDAFVLSCRVFGYGIETAILKRLIEDHKEFSIRGKIIENSVNAPCHRVFKDHGFTEEGGNVWLLQPNAQIILKPWLMVRS